MLDGLTFQPGGSTAVLAETRAGIPKYRGGPHGFEEWKFKVLGKVANIKKAYDEPDDDNLKQRKLIELLSNVIDSLEGDAVRIAMDMQNRIDLHTTKGVNLLVEEIESSIPYGDRSEDAQRLWQLGAKTHGELTRQRGESMVSYISRRRRWWLKLKELDPKIDVSETLLADYLLICSKITDADLKLCKSVCKGTDKTFDMIAAHLRTNHSNIHQSETGRKSEDTTKNSPPRNRPFFRGSNRGRGGGSRYYSKPQSSYRAHVAEEADEDSDQDSSKTSNEQTDDEHVDPDNVAFICRSCGPDNDFEDFEDRIEQDVVCAYLSIGADFDDPDVCQEVANTVHTECMAFVARDASFRRGVPGDRRIHSFRPPASELTLQQRRSAVDTAKSNSDCYRCLEKGDKANAKGHWAGDIQKCKYHPKHKASHNSKPHDKSRDSPKQKFKQRRYVARIAMAESSEDEGIVTASDLEKRKCSDFPRESVPTFPGESVPTFPSESVPTFRSEGDPTFPERESDPTLQSVVESKAAEWLHLKQQNAFEVVDEKDSRLTTDTTPTMQWVDVDKPNRHQDSFYVDEDSGSEISNCEDTANMHEDTYFPDNDPDNVEIDMDPGSVVDITNVPIFKFGQYQGIDFKTITEEETHYYFWAKKERRPSKYLSTYLEWVEAHYKPDDVRETVSSLRLGYLYPKEKRAFPKVQPKFKAAPDSANSKLTRKQAYEKSAKEPCTQCTRFDRGGTNHYSDNMTCMDCGRQVKSPKEPADPATCPHLNLCNAKSSKTTHRVTCANCGEVIYEEPQETFKARGCEAPGFENASSKAKPSVPEGREVTMSKEDAILASRTFPSLVMKHIKNSSDEIVKETLLKKILEEAVEITLGLGTPDEPTAMMAVRMKSKKEPSENSSDNGPDPGTELIKGKLDRESAKSKRGHHSHSASSNSQLDLQPVEVPTLLQQPKHEKKTLYQMKFSQLEKLAHEVGCRKQDIEEVLNDYGEAETEEDRQEQINAMVHIIYNAQDEAIRIVKAQYAEKLRRQLDQVDSKAESSNIQLPTSKKKARIKEEPSRTPPSEKREASPTHVMTGINVEMLPRKIKAQDLPRVNMKTDRRVFAYLDECCNRSCHSRDWRKNSVDKGMPFGTLEGEKRKFKGLGGVITSGKRKLTIGIESVMLNNTNQLNDGKLYSHEIRSGENPLLLSLAAQQTLGLVKDVDMGTCFWKAQQAFVQLYSVAGTSLRAIVIYDPRWNTVFPSEAHKVVDISVPADVQTSPTDSAEDTAAEEIAEELETTYKHAKEKGLVVHCSGCGSRNLIRDNFCWSCGEKSKTLKKVKTNPPPDKKDDSNRRSRTPKRDSSRRKSKKAKSEETANDSSEHSELEEEEVEADPNRLKSAMETTRRNLQLSTSGRDLMGEHAHAHGTYSDSDKGSRIAESDLASDRAYDDDSARHNSHWWKHQRKRGTQQVAEEEQDDSFRINIEEIDLSDEQLNKMRSMLRSEGNDRSYHFHNIDTSKFYDESLGEGHVFHVKKYTQHSWIKQTQWNKDCVRSCWIGYEDETWLKVEDREPIDTYRYLNKDAQPPETSCVVAIHRENYITPQGWMAEELEETDPRFTLDQMQRRRYLNSVENINHADCTMWHHIGSSAVETALTAWQVTCTLLKGCRTLIFPVLTVLILMQQIIGATSEANYKMPHHQAMARLPQHHDVHFIPAVEEIINDTQPFCIWFGYELDDQQPTAQLCKLVERTAQQYISDGRLVVLDAKWKKHLTTDLESCEDPLAAEFDGFNWSSHYGSNSGRVLTHCEDVIQHTPATIASRYNPEDDLTKEKVRMVVDSIAAESDCRNIHIAYPAHVVASEPEQADGPKQLDDLASERDEVSDGEAVVTRTLDHADDQPGLNKAVGKDLPDPEEENQELMDSLVADGFPKDEQKRRETWMQLPRNCRMAIRRLHHISNHKPKSVMLHLLRGARAPKELIKACEAFQCPTCLETQAEGRVVKFKMPSTYAFNYDVTLDIFFQRDIKGDLFGFLSIVCAGTGMHVAPMVIVGKGIPGSYKCLQKFQTNWTQWAGWPNFVTTDLGLHNRGVFARAVTLNGAYHRATGLEAHEHLGKGEHHGGLLKQIAKKMIRENNISGKQQMKLMMSVAVETKNDGLRVGGIAPSQWVIGKFPRRPGCVAEQEELGQLGVMQAQNESTTEFALRAKLRLDGRKEIVKIDCGRRFRDSQLKKAVPLPGEYEVGNLVMFRKEQEEAGNPLGPGGEWRGPARITGFDNKTVNLTLGLLPVTSAIHKLRPLSSAEMMAYILQNRNGRPVQRIPVVGANQQWQGLDARGPVPGERSSSPTARGRSTPRHSPPRKSIKTELRTQIETLPSHGAASSSSIPSFPARAMELEDRSQLERHLDSVSEPSRNPGRKLAEVLEKKRKDARTTDSRTRERSARRQDVTHESFIASLDEDVRSAITEYDEYVAFYSERVPSGAKEISTKIQKKQALEKRGKLLKYGKQPIDVQKLLNESRLTEWNRYKKFEAVTVISEKEATQLIEAGAECLPMQWIELDKNEARRTEGSTLPPNMRSRMVARGDLERQTNRTDSPTVADEAVLMICSWASSHKIVLRMCDLESGYFQGIKLWYTLVLKQPRTAGASLSDLDPEVGPTDYLLANVPIYGTKAAGRGLYFRVRDLVLTAGLQENFIYAALYSYSIDGEIKILLGTHVDDMLYGFTGAGEPIMSSILDQLEIGSSAKHVFRFTGKNFEQDPSSFEIRMSSEENTLRIKPIVVEDKRLKHGLDTATTPQEKSELRSSNGSTGWLIRCIRPEHSYEVSRLQQRCNSSVVQDLLDANRLIENLQSESRRGLTFKPGLDYRTAIIIIIADSSHAQEEEYVDDWQELEQFRSQGAHLIAIADPCIMQGKPGMFHPLSFGSGVVRRVCRSTVQAEAYNLDLCVEEADLIRAAIADIYGKLDTAKWEDSAAEDRHLCWITDCKSVQDALCRPVLSKITDKRLGITFAAMRQSLWRKKGGGKVLPRLCETRPEDTTDSIMWIDTDNMIVDCMTKEMETTSLTDALDSNIFDPRQSAESKQVKIRKQRSRSKSKKKMATSMATDSEAEEQPAVRDST